MRILLVLTLIIGSYLESSAQKIYITRETSIKLTKRLDNCRKMEQELAVANNKLIQIRKQLVLREQEIDNLNTVIAVAEVEYEDLLASYKEAIKHIPKRKRKKLGYEY